MTWKYWVSGPMLVPLVSTCHEIEFTDYSSALAFLSGSKCAVTHSYSAPSLSCHYFHRQVTKIILPGPDTPGGSASTALIIIPAPPSESLSECPARVESWPHQIPGAGRCQMWGQLRLVTAKDRGDRSAGTQTQMSAETIFREEGDKGQ